MATKLISSALDLGKLEVTKDGKTLIFRLQTVSDNLVEDVINYMVTEFLPIAPFASHCAASKHPESVVHMRKAYKVALSQGCGIVALLESEGSTPIIAGAQVTYVAYADDPPLNLEKAGARLRRGKEILYDHVKKYKILENYKTSKTLCELGLCVSATYQGLGLGRAILAANDVVCRALGVPLIATVFTSTVSQHIAVQLGFETIFILPFTEIIVSEEDPIEYNKTAIFMVKKIKL